MAILETTCLEYQSHGNPDKASFLEPNIHIKPWLFHPLIVKGVFLVCQDFRLNTEIPLTCPQSIT